MTQSFILSQVSLSSLPIGLFLILTITVFIFALVAALILAVLGAVVFTVVCVGIALIILLPTLFVTTFAAAFIWLWGVGAYFIVKWFNKKEIPGIHKPLGEGMQGMGLDALEGKGAAPGVPNATDDGVKKDADRTEEEKKHQPNGHKANGAPKLGEKKKVPGVDEVQKATGVDLSDPKKAADFGKVMGKTGDVNKAKDAVGGVAGGVKGVTGKVPGLG